MNNRYLSIDETVKYVNETFKKNVSAGNVSYLIKYGQIKRHLVNGEIHLLKDDINDYYRKGLTEEVKWKSKIGDDLNWALSFADVKEYERTKHVHRLHPYKGKFIPQLVEYFLDDHVNSLKKEVFFHPGDIVIDPFCGSGTTLVQANELGINAIGIDISEFNSLLSNIKVQTHDLNNLQKTISSITASLKLKFSEGDWNNFDDELAKLLTEFNKKNFPTPEILYRFRSGEINITDYTNEKVVSVNNLFIDLQNRHKLVVKETNTNNSFLNKWYTPPVKSQIIFLINEINKTKDEDIKQILQLILSRTSRSCRATTHSDLATLIEPIFEPYYCHKHNKICKPLFSMLYWWEFYSNDTVKRLAEFNALRTDTHQICITGDSKTIDLARDLIEKAPNLGKLLQEKKAKGIFSSPPYVGLIDYHEQHAYAYELFQIERRDSLEIGPQSKGKGLLSREKYIEDISSVLLNIKKYMQNDFEIFIVANDSFNIYPRIAEKSKLRIVEEFTRPVLNRTEKDKSAYSEKIIHLKDLE